MKKIEDFQPKVIGTPDYINENCWLAKTLNYPPTRRCQYCESKFYHCLFFQYLRVSLVLILFLFLLSFLMEGGISKLAIISIFTLVTVYGYFFNKSTEKIIEANFAQRKAKEALEELAKGLENQVRQRTKELKKAYEDLRVLDRAKSEFLSIASHQLRTPLTAIKGYVSLVLEGIYGSLNAKTKEILNRVYKSNERLIKLINDLLNISRIESGKIELTLEELQPEEIICDIAKELENEAKKKNLYLKLRKPAYLLPKVFIDKEKIREVVFNVIDNAIKYTEKGGVEIACEIKKRFLRVKIKDTGAGMSREEMSGLFRSFARGKTGSRLWTGGTGLGLYVAKEFLKIQKGRIWAESKGKDRGSTFYIELPIKK